MKMKRTGLYLAIAVFTLVTQVAVAAHVPALHEEPISKCGDATSHFCPERVERETGPCVLCQMSAGGVTLSLAGTPEVALQSESLAPAPVDGPRALLAFSSARPRGPPIA